MHDFSIYNCPLSDCNRPLQFSLCTFFFIYFLSNFFFSSNSKNNFTIPSAVSLVRLECSCASFRWLIFTKLFSTRSFGMEIPKDAVAKRGKKKDEQALKFLVALLTTCDYRIESQFWRISDKMKSRERGELICVSSMTQRPNSQRFHFPYHRSLTQHVSLTLLRSLTENRHTCFIYKRRFFLPRTHSNNRCIRCGPNKREWRRHKKTIVNSWLCVTLWKVY